MWFSIYTNVMKKPAKRWPYGVLAMILSVCIGLFIYQQYNEQHQQASTIPPVLDERILELYLQLDSFMNGKNRLYKASFDNFYILNRPLLMRNRKTSTYTRANR